MRDNVADYLAFGPVFTTHSKERPDPITGITALQLARAACPLPLVAIGGIERENLAEVLRTAVDCAAVIGAIADAPDPGRATAELLRVAAGARSAAPG